MAQMPSRMRRTVAGRMRSFRRLEQEKPSSRNGSRPTLSRNSLTP
ncbi:Uncharacterised protein [Bordetella pertussis]|nr:Uncharacterised protein [Bordetella pertussis]